MKADITLDLKASSPEEAQRILKNLCNKLVIEGAVRDYRFEIETDAGVVTEKCILSQGAVVA